MTIASPSFFEEEPIPDRSQSPISRWQRAECPPAAAAAEWTHDHLRKFVKFTDIYSQRRADERHLETVMAAASPVQEAVQENSARQGTEWLLAEFKTFLEQLHGKLEGKENQTPTVAPKPRIKPIRTPRSGTPLVAARPAELLRPEFAKGRLYFSCPCCRFPAALPVWLSGKKARCPRCYSAIRAPHPRKGLQARIMENDIESLLHPERFSSYGSAHRLIPWLGVPRPKFYPSLHAAALVILCFGLGLFALTVFGKKSRGHDEMRAGSSLAQAIPLNVKDRARKVVEQFLAAESISAKASLVRDSARVAPLMADWYRRHPRQLNAATAQVDTSGTGFYPNDREHTVTSVRVAFPAAEDQVFLVEHSPAGDRIEWESSVGYNASPDQLAASGQDGHSKTVRAMGCLDDYFNFSYSDRSTHLCVRLHDPASRELLGYGYIPLDSAHAESIAAYLSGGSQEELRPLMVEVRPRDDTGKTHQMEIVRMIETGWRSDQLAATSPEPPRIDLSQFNQRPQ